MSRPPRNDTDEQGAAHRGHAPARWLPRDNRTFGLLWGARTLSSLGDGFTAVSWMAYATRAEASGARMGMLFFAEIAPTFLSPWLGLLSDRVDRRRIMIAAELLQACAMLALVVLPPSFELLLTCALVRALFSAAMKPAAVSAVPVLVHGSLLPAANAWLRGGEEGAAIVGPLLAGTLVPWIGLRGMFAVDAVTFFLASAVLLALPRFQVPVADASAPRAPSGALAGVRSMREHPTARALAICLFVFVLFAALENVPRPFLAARTLGAGTFGIGLLWAMAQVGMVAGLFAMGRAARLARPSRLLPLGMAIYGIGSLLTAFAPSLLVAAIGQVVSGVGNGLEVGCADTLLQSSVPPSVMGRVVANVYGAASIAAGVAYSVSGPMLDHSSPRIMFGVVAAGCLLAALLTLRLLPRGDSGTVL